MNEFINADCFPAMLKMESKKYDLAIIDPPYGIDVNKMQLGSGKYKTDKGWDSKPPERIFFKELIRVSKKVIIFGANHFIENIPNQNSSCWIVWDKLNGTSDFADCELAWTNFDRPVRKYALSLQRGRSLDNHERFHPTEKPVHLYKWILKNFATPGDKILDTHAGSGSSIIACLDMGYDYTAFEIDSEYWTKASSRIRIFNSQTTLF